MTWVTDNYKNPTEAQLMAEKARKMLHDLDIPCDCKFGETPKEHYFTFDDGNKYPSYIPTMKMCRKCELNNLLYCIQDPDDCAGNYT